MTRDWEKRSKANVPFGQMESVRLCLFDGTIDELGASVAGGMEGERAGGGWHGGYYDSCRRGSRQASCSQYASLIEVWIDESEQRIDICNREKGEAYANHCRDSSIGQCWTSARV